MKDNKKCYPSWLTDTHSLTQLFSWFRSFELLTTHANLSLNKTHMHTHITQNN